MSLASKLQDLVDGLESTRVAITGKGATLPVGSPLGDYPDAVDSIEGGGGGAWVTEPGPGDVTTATGMFQNWAWITEIELFDTSNVTLMGNMFHGCSSLKSVPLLDTSNAAYAQNMFHGCSSLKSVPLLDASSMINMSNMFRDCSLLESVPIFDTTNATNMSGMFYGCSELTGVEFTDCSKVTNTTGMFGTTATNYAATSLEQLILPGITRGFDLPYTQMSATALNDFFDSLGTANGSQTINITGAPGAATCDKSIATAKGWTITG